jgi:hypothetical protein
MLDLSIIIISWNTRELTRKCLASVFKYTKDINFAVWVVDNNSKDDSVEMIKKEFPQVHLIVNPDNFGFAKANNQGIKSAEKSKYYLLLNSDTEIENNVSADFIKYADEHIHKSRLRVSRLRLMSLTATSKLTNMIFPHVVAYFAKLDNASA